MNKKLVLSQKLLLADLSMKNHIEINAYKTVKEIDLSLVNKIDSAGIAYLVQIKIKYPALVLIKASAKLQVLAELYGVEHLFDK